MRFGELFAGAGGLSLGLERAGMECAFHAEIEPFPRRVLEHRWPNVPLYGDVTTLDGAKLIAECGPIDLLSGGSPCQDLSVAGKRKGMTEGSGTRSSLFFEQVRLYNETNAEYLLWENVDGARSSNNGKDFACVLSALVGGTVAVPGDGWRSAGVAVGAAGIAAWRVLDAQFFGVPQRRRRVFVLCSRTGRVDPAEVLLEREGLRRDTPKGRGQRQDAAASPGNGASSEGGVELYSIMPQNSGKDYKARKVDVTQPLTTGGTNPSSAQGGDVIVAGTLGASGAGLNRPAGQCNELDFVMVQGAVPLQEIGKRTGVSTADVRAGIGIGAEGDPMFTLQAEAQHGVLALTPWDCESKRVFGAEGVFPTLYAAEKSGQQQQSVLAFDTTQITSPGNYSSPKPGDPCHPLASGAHPPAICATGEVTHALVKRSDSSEDGTGRGTPIVAYNETGHEKWTVEDVAGSLNAHEAKECHTIVAPTIQGHTRQQVDAPMAVTTGIPRRLLPIECERLMSWPDGWTDVPDENGKPASDSARYRACGNGVASVCAEWIGERLLAEVGQRIREMEGR